MPPKITQHRERRDTEITSSIIRGMQIA